MLGRLGPVVQGLPADGHGDDDRLPARIEKLSGGGDPPGYQHPQGAQCHKNCTHQWVGIVIVFCVGRKTLASDNRPLNVRNTTLRRPVTVLKMQYSTSILVVYLKNSYGSQSLRNKAKQKTQNPTKAHVYARVIPYTKARWQCYHTMVLTEG